MLATELQNLGAKVRAFDPVAEENAKLIFKGVEYASSPYYAVQGADALLLVTEWNEFRNLDMRKVKELMSSPILIDGRNIYEPKEMAALGFMYTGVGR